MNTNQSRHPILPIRYNLTIVYALSVLIAALMVVVSAAGLLRPTLVYPTEDHLRAFVPNDAVNLLVGLPILLGSMGLAWRGRLLGLLCWPGALFYVLYNSFGYLFALPFGWVFLLYLVLVTLSVYTLISLLVGIDAQAVQGWLGGKVHERLAGGVLAGLGVLFSLRVIAVTVGALTGGAAIAETELAVHTADFLITPAWVIGGVLLWRRHEFGYAIGLGLLFQASMLFIAVIMFLVLQPFLTDAPFAAADVLVLLAMGLICFVPFALYARGVAAQRGSPSP